MKILFVANVISKGKVKFSFLKDCKTFWIKSYVGKRFDMIWYILLQIRDKKIDKTLNNQHYYMDVNA
jgi:uncharacterized protein YprB with RNaseH-like and TPR domain